MLNSMELKLPHKAQISNFIQWHRFQIKMVQERIWYWGQKTLSEFSLMDLFVQKMCTILHLIPIRLFNYLAIGMITNVIFDQNDQNLHSTFGRKWSFDNHWKIEYSILWQLHNKYCWHGKYNFNVWNKCWIKETLHFWKKQNSLRKMD